MRSAQQRVERSRPQWWDDRNDRAMVICRISDRKQKDGVSLDAQERQQREYAKEAGLVLVKTKPFQESAKRSNMRAQFHAAIEEARREKILHLVFYVYDRVARNFTDAEMLEEMIRDGEIVLHIAGNRSVLHRDSPDSDFFMFDMNIAHAKQDNRNRRSKTIDGMVERCHQGWYPSRPPSFYEQVPTLDEHGRPKRRGSTVGGPTEEGRRLVRREMELHLSGFSLERIREACLAEQLVPAKLIATYHCSTVEKHLKQDFYAAIPKPHDGFKSQFVWRGIAYEGKHEPIFTADEWRKLGESFGKRSLYRKLKHDGVFAQGPLSLTCEECGCKITYAPKTKSSGLTYHYYRCADGRRVHRDKREPQVNVKEDEILAQLAMAVDAIEITSAFAKAIADALNATHRDAMATKARSADVYRAEIRAFEEKEDRLFDRFDSGEIDRETYDRQLLRVRDEKNDRLEKLAATNTESDAAYLETAQDVLELAKQAKSLLKTRSPEEQRDFLARLVCNPRLDGRTVCFDLRKPFAVLAKMRAANDWRPQRDSNPR
jgi:site-specific DNA recombinase